MIRTLKRSSSIIALLVLLSFTGVGCFGSFGVTGKLYNWNKSFDNKWGQEGVFLGLAILPVYGLCLLGDALIFNSIEFWSGKNPISEVRTLKQGNETAVLSFYANGKNLKIEKYLDGKLDRTLMLEKVDAQTLKVVSNDVVRVASISSDIVKIEAGGETEVVMLQDAAEQVALLVK